MFENLKTGNMIRKLSKLAKYTKRLEDYDKSIKDFIPKNVLHNDTADYFMGNHNLTYHKYTLKLNNIDYIFNEKNNYYIKVNDIIVAKGYQFEGIETVWNHTLPKEMLSQIKEDSKMIDVYIKDIKQYIKNNPTTEQIKHCEEDMELRKIFCNKLK